MSILVCMVYLSRLQFIIESPDSVILIRIKTWSRADFLKVPSKEIEEKSYFQLIDGEK